MLPSPVSVPGQAWEGKQKWAAEHSLGRDFRPPHQLLHWRWQGEEAPAYGGGQGKRFQLEADHQGLKSTQTSCVTPAAWRPKSFILCGASQPGLCKKPLCTPHL